MTSLVVNDIPKDVMRCVRSLARTEHISVNNELVFLLENGLFKRTVQSRRCDCPTVSMDAEAIERSGLSGRWDD
ncbi:MAG: hypothetical protein A2Y33_14680 [Spirochaetes bacterium GWF1_51_8]|nr:MAG: hypothetical protein A2Y33_14680 [Spirochaetes bacterium GWF1_51_8]